MSVSSLAVRLRNAKQLDFSFNLEQMRTEKGLNRNQLNKTCGFAPHMIARFETAEIAPTMRQIIKLCQALGCSSSELIGI